MKYPPEFFHRADRKNLPGELGMRCLELGAKNSLLEMTLTDKHLNVRGFAHGGSIVALADTAAGYAAYANLPEGAEGFTTIELKTNFLRAVQSGATLRCRAKCIHMGRATQVWDATVFESGEEKTIAEFRCTQMILYPQPQQPVPSQGAKPAGR